MLNLSTTDCVTDFQSSPQPVLKPMSCSSQSAVFVVERGTAVSRPRKSENSFMSLMPSRCSLEPVGWATKHDGPLIHVIHRQPVGPERTRIDGDSSDETINISRRHMRMWVWLFCKFIGFIEAIGRHGTVATVLKDFLAIKTRFAFLYGVSMLSRMAHHCCLSLIGGCARHVSDTTSNKR